MMASSMLVLVAAGFVAVALAVLVVAVVWGAGEATGVARSLALIEKNVAVRDVAKHDLPAMERLLVPILDRTRKLGDRLSPAGTGTRLAALLDKAGNPAAWTPERLMGAKGAGLVFGALVGLLIGGFTVRGLLFALGAGAGGLWTPDLLLYNVGMKRQEQLQRGLADALDMLTVCVEAGQGFDAALLQVARSVDGPVAGEFARVLSEIQIGRSRGEAFSMLGERTTVIEVKTFVSALVQADRMGLPLAKVLREQSMQMRTVRRQKAEEKAQKVPVKILFPMLLFIFPALFIVIIGPGAIQMMDTFTGAV